MLFLGLVTIFHCKIFKGEKGTDSSEIEKLNNIYNDMNYVMFLIYRHASN